MAKFCIFCGKPPAEKNKEHVIPHWLIQMTGDPNRKVRLGLMKESGNPGTFREYAFNHFTFPACEECNSKHSDLESEAKDVMTDVLAGSAVSGLRLSRFLDWFDKVRVGLWLGFQQLDKNFANVVPQFHISDRIGQFDRMLIIEKADFAKERLSFGGTDSIAFAFMPSAFALIVNNYCFINVSSLFLFARRIGFPYPSSMYKDPSSQSIICEMEAGRDRIMRPLIRHTIVGEGIRIFQPMFGSKLEHGDRSNFYDASYVKSHCYDHNAGIGAVFIESGRDNICPIRADEEVILSPKTSGHEVIQTLNAIVQTLNWQNWLMEHAPSLELLSPEERSKNSIEYSMAKKVNDIFIAHHRKMLRDAGVHR